MQLSLVLHASITSAINSHAIIIAADVVARAMPDLFLVPETPHTHVATNVHEEVQAQPKVHPQTVTFASGSSGQPQSCDRVTRDSCMPSMFAIPSLPTYAMVPSTSNTPVQGLMPPMYVDAIRNIIPSTFQSQPAPMQLSIIDKLSNTLSSFHANAFSEVKAMS